MIGWALPSILIKGQTQHKGLWGPWAPQVTPKVRTVEGGVGEWWERPQSQEVTVHLPVEGEATGRN